jgi:hypothetical protein
MEEARTLYRAARQLPSQDPDDPDYRRLPYVRYADDWLRGFAGPKTEAEEIKLRLRTFLRDDLKLELSEAKTLLTHARHQAARFLGYEISSMHADDRVEGHHLRKLADLKRPGQNEVPGGRRLMAARKRKTLVTCRACQEAIHAGRPTRPVRSA